MMIFLSEELNLEDKLEKLNVFDPILNFDSNYFINIIRLRTTEVPEFKGSYDKINDYFKKIGILLKISNSRNDRTYKKALDSFNFPELEGIGLGFSQGGAGAGFGPILKENVIKDAKEILDKSEIMPEIFHLVGLFEENVGPDRISDMIATIIYEDIVNYTLRINETLGINAVNYPDYKFKNSMLVNPYKEHEILLLPKCILHELPIARSWEDIDRVISENSAIKGQINDIIGSKWKKLPISWKKNFLKDYVFKNPDELKKLISSYKETELDSYDFENDPIGDIISIKIGKRLLIDNPLTIKDIEINSMTISMKICEKFKDIIENNKGYEILYDDNKKHRNESVAQRVFLIMAIGYCEQNNLDISPESNAGRGPVDFKMSRGLDKTIVEIKLTSNQNVVHGYTTQIEEYAKAEKTQNKILMLIDNGKYSSRANKLAEVYNQAKINAPKDNKAQIPELIIIDAKPKASASKY